jgi:hypothetical protein
MTTLPPLATRQIAWRLFLTCWIVYVLRFATDVVREHYPAIALADHFSFRLDEYGGLHPDLFETAGRGWHIGNNPGGSMVAVIPYAVFKPAVDAVVRRVLARRAASGANTGIRYLTPVFPFLFVPAALVLARMRPQAAYAWGLLALVVSWPLAMYREVEAPLGLLDPIVRTFAAGFALPPLNTLGLTSGQYGDFFAKGVSPLPLFVVAGAVIYGLWTPRLRGR